MLSDYNAHNRQEEHKLGSNVRCHHIQIDESKFGKRKNHRGHRVEGIWVFGMVECLVPVNEADRFYTYTDHRTGEQELRPTVGGKMVPMFSICNFKALYLLNYKR
ncbi:hypothetical protein G6F49_013691 [Rhizopus delemar]|nr:hypothetical protein G6F49_013691 [Rhizopus delemar]